MTSHEAVARAEKRWGLDAYVRDRNAVAHRFAVGCLFGPHGYGESLEDAFADAEAKEMAAYFTQRSTDTADIHH